MIANQKELSRVTFMREFEELKCELAGVRANVSLKNHTTFKIGGAAKYFFVAQSSADIQKAVKTATKLGIRYFLLSGGSNLLVADKGYDGLVVKIQNTAYKISGTQVIAEAGVEVNTIVRETTQRGLAGLEWAGGLPGTVGGAVRGNAGAFGGETKDPIFSVQILDKRANKKTFSKKQCSFGYRNSIVKKKGYVVLSATFQLHKGNKKELQQTAQEHIAYRNIRHPLEYPNAGSIFKNCDVKKVSKKVQKEFAEVVKQDPFPVIPTAAIISKAQLQGLRVGGAEVSKKHPNYIVNTKHATAQDVLELIKKIQQKIKRAYTIDLETEIQFVS